MPLKNFAVYNIHQHHSTTMKEQILNVLRSIGILTPEVEAQVRNAVPDTPPNPDNSQNYIHNASAINALRAELESIKQDFAAKEAQREKQLNDVLTTLGEEKAAREAAVSALQEKATADQKAKVTAYIQKMKENKQIPAQNEQQEAHWIALFEQNFEATAAIVDALPVAKPAPAPVAGSNNNNTNAPQPSGGFAGALRPEVRAYLETQSVN
jgi:hypothetical protein